MNALLDEFPNLFGMVPIDVMVPNQTNIKLWCQKSHRIWGGWVGKHGECLFLFLTDPSILLRNLNLQSTETVTQITVTIITVTDLGNDWRNCIIY